MTERRTLRCAVYTRKSTEEGLEQDFNSLQAQREACESFIRSQRSEGWILVPTAYDDGGISGGTMERPALKRLFAHIEEKRVDVIVVYKVDRLTRSLSDFSKMVDLFDRNSVSFVAVTQQFNTTTSMGRLTLNVLLSFAQFEREVTAERIRDKIAASKKKGIWMGGGLPRGYRVEDRKLIVVPEEAEIVRRIYARYLNCSSIRELTYELKREGITAMRTNDPPEKKPALSRGALYALLKNPIYTGLISHKGQMYPGQHEGIVDRKVWEAVQEKLEASRRYSGKQQRTAQNPLKGKLFDERGRPLISCYANKKGKRYRYYVSHFDHLDDDRLHQKVGTDWRLSAPEIERRVGEIVEAMVSDGAELVRAATGAQMNAAEIDALLRMIEGAEQTDYLGWVVRVVLDEHQISVTAQIPASKPIRLEQTLRMIMKRRGVERRLVISPDKIKAAEPDLQILKAIRTGFKFWEQLKSDQPLTAVKFAKQEGVDNRYVGRTLVLAFLAPDIVERLVSGRHPPDWTAERLLCWNHVPSSWTEQQMTFK